MSSTGRAPASPTISTSAGEPGCRSSSSFSNARSGQITTIGSRSSRISKSLSPARGQTSPRLLESTWVFFSSAANGGWTTRGRRSLLCPRPSSRKNFTLGGGRRDRSHRDSNKFLTTRESFERFAHPNVDGTQETDHSDARFPLGRRRLVGSRARRFRGNRVPPSGGRRLALEHSDVTHVVLEVARRMRRLVTPSPLDHVGERSAVEICAQIVGEPLDD